MLYEILKTAKLGATAAPDMFTGLIASKMPFAKGGIAELSGVPPLRFTSNGEPLLDWRITGSGTPTSQNPVEVVGVGERTENLFNDTNIITNAFFTNGIIGDAPIDIRPRNIIYVPIQGGETYTFSIRNLVSDTSFQSVCSVDAPSIGTSYRINDQTTFITHGSVRTFTRTMPQGANWWAIQIMSLDNLSNNIIINEGSTALPYEPYGYKIPVTCGGVTTDIYIGDSPLYDGDTISMTDTGIEIPTVRGSNVLTVNTTVQPSEVYIKYQK